MARMGRVQGAAWWRLVAALALVLGLVAGALGAPGRAAAAPPAGGRPYAWGDDSNGRLGDGAGDSSTGTPVGVAGLADAVAVSAGGSHSLALTSTGQVYAWGNDYFGQLGDGKTGPNTDQPAPVAVQLPAGVTVVAVAAGGLHSLALASDGRVYAWGVNSNGELGNGPGSSTATGIPVAVQLPAGVAAVAVAAGAFHSLALASDGRAYAWGADDAGQLGDGGTNTNQPAPVAVALPAGLAAVALAGGTYHSLAVLAPRTAVAASGAATAGGAATLTATVTRQDTGQPVPAGGPVTFSYNGNTYGGTTDANGVATATAPLPAGTQSGTYAGAVGANYAGAIGYAPGQGRGPLTVAASPATTVNVTGTATAGGDGVALRAAVARQSDGAPVPAGGPVTFTYNGQTYGASTDANGVAATNAPLPAGTQPGTYPGAVRASYAGTTGYAASQGEGPLTVAAGPAAPATPATAVNVTGTATAGGASVALRAAVARQADGAPVPAGGAVTFAYNGATYSATTGANGVATATAPLPANTQPGSYPGAVRASYAGAAGYAASQGEGPLNVATASCAARFADVADTDPACPAILALVNRGVIYGYATDPPTFGPLTRVQRAQVAAFLVRALGWGERPQGPRTFSDLAPLEGTDLARAVRIVANACDSRGCVAQGPGDGTFQPTKEVTKAEVIAFLARAFRMDSKYAWAPQPGAPQPHSGVPAAFDTDVRTYAYYAGAIPDAPTTADGWNAPASRAWVARVLYQALATKP